MRALALVLTLIAPVFRLKTILPGEGMRPPAQV
jgi:hypothetical protein